MSTEQLLKAIGVDKDSPLRPGNGPVPIDVPHRAEQVQGGTTRVTTRPRVTKATAISRAMSRASLVVAKARRKARIFWKGFGSLGGKGKGPCFICGRMRHRAVAECFCEPVCNK